MKSIIELQGKERLQEIVDATSSYSDVLREYALSPAGSGGRTVLYRLINEWEIDLTKFKSNPKITPNQPTKVKMDELFCKDSRYPQTTLRRYARRLLDNSYCWICGISEEWQGQTLSMVLDHINGDNTDHRYENLRFVCPNCNSLLDTTGSRNGRKL